MFIPKKKHSKQPFKKGWGIANARVAGKTHGLFFLKNRFLFVKEENLISNVLIVGLLLTCNKHNDKAKKLISDHFYGGIESKRRVKSSKSLCFFRNTHMNVFVT
ncbi:MAG TPA: hypothetical protein DFH96_03865 [Bacteroidetes bacterium]|nr:hypothetical protein [Bacteroidota bacterium]